ncbi:hypothetical protein FACS1894137_04570 [Spirochaetia bacterium]|nr:hypothetical protein FACS1894137_04570 [Spirochaetia bacterium]
MKKDDKIDLETNKSVPIVLNDKLIRLGRFEDVVTNNSIEEKIDIGFGCRLVKWSDWPVLPVGFKAGTYIEPTYIEPYDRHFSIDFSFGLKNTSESTQNNIRLFSSNFSTPESEDNSTFISTTFMPENEIDIANFNDNSKKGMGSLLEATNYKTTSDHNTLQVIGYQNHTLRGCQYKHFLPYRTIHVVNAIDDYTRMVVNILQNSNPMDEIYSINMQKNLKPFTEDAKLFDSAPLEFAQKMYFPDTIIRVMLEILNENVLFREKIKETDLFPDNALRFSDYANIEKLFRENIKKTDSFRDALSFSDWANIVNSQKIGDKTAYAFRSFNDLYGKNDLYKTIYDATKEALIENNIEIKETSIIAVDLSLITQGCLDYIENYFSSRLKYLGPLRDPPKSIYPIVDFEGSKNVGIIGENVAAVFDTYKDTLIDYISTNDIQTGKITKITENIPLKKAVNDWLNYLDVAGGVKTKNMGKLGVTLSVKMRGSKVFRDFANVGVGVSQVFPIVVMCLIADSDTTFLFEQPELHLHPRVQSRLGDFFLSMTFLHKQCIIETHSEYLIDKIRYRIVEEKDDKTQISDSIKLYFAEKKGDYTNFEEIKINKYGVISEWPDGFFDESYKIADQIISAALKKSAKEDGND